MLESLDIAIRLSVYVFELIIFVLITRKLFFEKTSWKRTILRILGCAFLSPVMAVLVSDYIAIDVLEDFQGQSVQSIVSYSISYSLFQIVGLVLFLVGYVKFVKAKNASIAMFVFLCFAMMVPNLYYDVLLEWPLIGVTLQAALVIAFYFVLVPPLSRLTKERMTTNSKLFILLPALTTLYNSVTFIMSMIIFFKVTLMDEDIKFIGEMIRQITTDENADLVRDKVRGVFQTSIERVPDMLFYSVAFVTLVLIIAFAVIVQNIQYLNETIKAKEQLKELNREVMEALARTIDAKDMYTKGHSMRVAKYARMIAEKMGLSEERQESVYYMGLLHDIGKIAVPNEIINKKSKLTDAEFSVVQVHTSTGYGILAEIKSRPDLAFGAEYHHERVDGKGYPEHLKGDEIPLEARIIAVADSYDAMTSNRSYRDLLPQEKVRSELLKNIGTQFDEKPAKCMVAIMDEDTEYQLHE